MRKASTTMTFAFRDGCENPFITLAGWTYRAATFETVAEIFREACMMMTVDVPCESVKTRRNLWCSTFLPADFGRPPFFSSVMTTESHLERSPTWGGILIGSWHHFLGCVSPSFEHVIAFLISNSIPRFHRQPTYKADSSNVNPKCGIFENDSPDFLK